VRSNTKEKKKNPWSAYGDGEGVVHVETPYSVENQGRMTQGRESRKGE